MKKSFIFILLFIFITAAMTVYANSYTGSVKYIQARNDSSWAGFFVMLDTSCSSSVCSGTASSCWFHIPKTDNNSDSMFSLALAAFLSGKVITISTQNTCVGTYEKPYCLQAR